MRIRGAIDRISHRGAEVAAIGTAGVGLFAFGLDSDASETQRRFIWRLLTLLAGLVVAISLTGFFYLKRQQTSARADVYSNLNAIANLKMAQIVNWRNERLSDARFLFQAPFVARDITALFAQPESVEVRTGVSRWLDLMRMGGLYESAMLFDAQMNLRLELPGPTATRTPGPVLRGQLAAALRSNDAVLTDLHRLDAGDPIHLDLIVPVIPSDPAPTATNPPPALSRPAPIAVIVLRLNPESFLFPMIQTWPTPSATAETLLVRGEGEEVVFLNELRHRHGTALALRRPMSDPLLPAAMIARGERGLFEGVDYRGVPVLSDVRAVPDSPWMLVTKVDQAEAYAPIRAEAWRTGLLISLLLLAVALAAAYLWRQRHATLLHHELTLERERKALAERLALLTRHANDIILLLDETGRIVEANDRALTSYGYTLDELRQLPPGGLRPPGAQENLPQQLDLFASREGAVFETVHRRKDGMTFPIEVSGRTVEIEGRQFSLGIYRDLTARKRAETEKEKLEDQNRQLQKSESLGRMAGAIAHHFNNQLQAVMMCLELAMNDLSRAAEGSGSFEFLTKAMQSARKAAEVSSLMLTYLGQSHGKREPLDLSEACLRSLPLLRAVRPQSVALETDLLTPGPTINANANQIQQVLTNLVTNAWEASGDGRGAIRLTVKTVSAADIPAVNRFPIDWQPQATAYACLEVADAGCGIADPDIEKIFDPFFSTKFTGRGLGLSVVLGIVRAHCGVITVASEPSRGSVFRVFLPVSAEAVPQKPFPEPGRAELPLSPNLEAAQRRRPTRFRASEQIRTEPGSLPAASGPKTAGGGTVLVVEDESAVRKMVTLALQRLGFTVLAAEDGLEAVAVFRQHQDEIRCVLCDLTMPRMNGWETLTALRKLAPGIPVILSSGYSEAQVMEGDHSELPQAFLSKPYEHKALINAISQVLANRKG